MSKKESEEIFGTDILLMLLYAPGPTGKINEPISGKTRLQKELFLAQKQLQDEEVRRPFSFMPYDLGPYSKELYRTVDWLIQRGMIVENKKSNPYVGVYPEYSLTEEGIRRVEEMLRQPQLHRIYNVIQIIKRKFNQMDLAQLVEMTHRLYSEYVRKRRETVSDQERHHG